MEGNCGNAALGDEVFHLASIEKPPRPELHAPDLLLPNPQPEPCGRDPQGLVRFGDRQQVRHGAGEDRISSPRHSLVAPPRARCYHAGLGGAASSRPLLPERLRETPRWDPFDSAREGVESRRLRGPRDGTQGRS
jgi:hypothetical protein